MLRSIESQKAEFEEAVQPFSKPTTLFSGRIHVLCASSHYHGSSSEILEGFCCRNIIVVTCGVIFGGRLARIMPIWNIIIYIL